jgi:hypothetical protein
MRRGSDLQISAFSKQRATQEAPDSPARQADVSLVVIRVAPGQGLDCVLGDFRMPHSEVRCRYVAHLSEIRRAVPRIGFVKLVLKPA